MRWPAVLLVFTLSACVTYPQPRPAYPQPYPQQERPRVNVGGGINRDGAGGWLNTIINLGQCAIMPSVYGGTVTKPNGNVQINCN